MARRPKAAAAAPPAPLAQEPPAGAGLGYRPAEGGTPGTDQDDDDGPDLGQPRTLRREERDPRSLRPSARNARTHDEGQIEQLRLLIRRFGFTGSVLVRDDGGVEGEIIAGHGRTRAAVLEGLPLVPVVVADGWTEDEVRAYMLADNQVALRAGWDEEILRAELAELDRTDFDIGLLGFSDVELKDLLPAAPEDVTPPEQFPSFGEDVEIKYCCPKCGYRWSGKADGAAG